ncbi:MAG TPA: host attachment protein [Nevskiales bacterium]|nr:host attachment protein [Nevskiales bacterium]
MRRYRDELNAPHRVCIMAADAARARLFAAGPANSGLHELDTLVNPEARTPERKLTSDRPGRKANSSGRGTHSFGERAKPHREAVDSFARRIGQRLRAARTVDRFDRIYLVAEPEVLGMIRRTLDERTRKCVVGEVSKSLTRRSAKTIRAALPARL